MRPIIKLQVLYYKSFRDYLRASPDGQSDQRQRRWGWGHGKPYRSVCCENKTVKSQTQSKSIKCFIPLNSPETDAHRVRGRLENSTIKAWVCPSTRHIGKHSTAYLYDAFLVCEENTLCHILSIRSSCSSHKPMIHILRTKCFPSKAKLDIRTDHW